MLRAVCAVTLRTHRLFEQSEVLAGLAELHEHCRLSGCDAQNAQQRAAGKLEWEKDGMFQLAVLQDKSTKSSLTSCFPVAP